MATFDIILTFIDFVFGIILIFFTIIIFSPINKFKKFKVKEEQLFLQKTLITTIFFSLFILLNLIGLFSKDLKKYFYIIGTFMFNVYIVLLLLYNLMMTLEMYRTYKNPAHYFNRLFRQYKYNYLPEFIIIIIGVISLAADFGISYSTNGIFNDDEKDIIICYLLLINHWKPIIILILVIVCIIFYCKIKSLINKFYFKSSDKLIIVINKRSMNYFLYLVYALFYLFPYISKYINDNSEVSDTFKFFATIFFYVVIIDDYMIHISEIASSKSWNLFKTLFLTVGYMIHYIKNIIDYFELK